MRYRIPTEGRSTSPVSPADLRQLLWAVHPASLRADLETLKHLYRQNATQSQVSQAQVAFAKAIAGWSDEQVADFLVNEFFEPPFSIELLSKPANERREVLSALYQYLFVE
jgi:hypothetical protein